MKNWINNTRLKWDKMKSWINDKKQWIDWTWKSDEKWEKHRIEITQKTPNWDETNEWIIEWTI